MTHGSAWYALAGLLVATVVAGCQSGSSGGSSTPAARVSAPPSSSSSSNGAPSSAPTASSQRPTAPSQQSTAPSQHPTASIARAIPDLTGATSPPLPQCAQGGCSAAALQPLAGGYAIRAWQIADLTAHPVLELVSDGRPKAWLMMLRGDGTGSTVTCDTKPPASAQSWMVNCVVVSGVGLHAALAEMVLMSGSDLIDTGAYITATTPRVVAVDLNGDGYLDLAARDSDYKPNFAEGHLFDRTYSYDRASGRFVGTGCTAALADPAHAPAPTTLQVGRCPVS
ncbi:MAG: hypothetical protein JWO63_2838 [Frankiales bacterium]|nr:hypothetical protein [Frankiales bacterium]